MLENAQEVYGIDLRLKYDPAVIEVLDADPAKEGVQAAPGPFLKPDFVVRNTADNTAGTLQYVITQVNPTSPASGTGVVLAFQVRGRQAGETPISFESVVMADRRGQTLAVTPASGTIKVVAASAAPATETPRAGLHGGCNTGAHPGSGSDRRRGGRHPDRHSGPASRWAALRCAGRTSSAQPGGRDHNPLSVGVGGRGSVWRRCGYGGEVEPFT